MVIQLHELKVLSFSSAGKALDALKDLLAAPLLILVDLLLPDMDGLEFLELYLKKNLPSERIVFMTASKRIVPGYFTIHKPFELWTFENLIQMCEKEDATFQSYLKKLISPYLPEWSDSTRSYQSSQHSQSIDSNVGSRLDNVLHPLKPFHSQNLNAY
jgi:CheY-like chemotaxis protein